MVSDGELNDQEILYLKTWCDENAHLANEYPSNIVFRRVHKVLLDGVIDAEERSQLLDELQKLSGNFFSQTGAAVPEVLDLAFDNDPMVIFPENHFVFTGDFLFGTRNACHKATESRGGEVDDSVTRKTNYLIVGSLASPAWFAENYGRKIQKAVEMAQSGDFEISIVRENDWAMALGSAKA